MLSKSQQRLLLALQKKKERQERGLFILEGEKFVRDAGNLVEFSFTDKDTTIFREVISTEAPQAMAAVARVPAWTMDDVLAKPTIVVLDGVQDPGNVGTILRACLGFKASLLLIESAEVTNPKTVRSSAGAILHVPWLEVSRAEAEKTIIGFQRPIFRLELRKGAIAPKDLPSEPKVLIAGNEGKGIRLSLKGQSVAIPHDPMLESLNVAMATALVLYEVCRTSR